MQQRVVGAASVRRSYRHMQKPHQSNLRKHRISISGQAYAITKRKHKTFNPILTANDHLASILIEAFFHHQKQMNIQIGAFIVMPDHYHLLFRLLSSKALSEIIHSISSFTANQINRLIQASGPAWQDGYYEHTVRKNEALLRQAEYIENNPVRKELCKTPGDWHYSSANQKWAKMIDRSWF